MAEEERGGLTDFRRHVGLAQRHDLAVAFAAFEARHVTGVTPVDKDPAEYVRRVEQEIEAVDALQRAGIGAPYTLAIGPVGHTRIVESTEHGGYLLIGHLRRVLDGAVVRVPGLDAAVVVSWRGGDFRLTVGQDLSIGYSSHDADTVSFYLEESVAFRVLEPDAAVTLTG